MSELKYNIRLFQGDEDWILANAERVFPVNSFIYDTENNVLYKSDGVSDLKDLPFVEFTTS